MLRPRRLGQDVSTLDTSVELLGRRFDTPLFTCPVAALRAFHTQGDLKRLKDATSMKVLAKGIVTREEAELAEEHGADGVYVSNHGGRGVNMLRGTIDALPEVVEGVDRVLDIILDEFRMVMRQTRTTAVDQIRPDFLMERDQPIMTRHHRLGFGL